MHTNEVINEVKKKKTSEFIWIKETQCVYNQTNSYHSKYPPVLLLDLK